MSDFAAAFDLDPAGYAGGRPGYPSPLFSLLEKRCGLGKGCLVIEIGPGTGQATAELLRRGANVHAIEPGAGLAGHLLATQGGEALDVTISSFEDAALDDGAADLVVAATSFHWVEPGAGLEKVASSLRPGGWIALWWNLFYDPTDPDAFSCAIEPLYAELGNREPSVADARDEELWLAVLGQAGFEEVAADRFSWEVEHRADDLVALYSTFSGTRMRPPQERARFLAGVRAVADGEFGGRVRRSYQTALYTARKPGNS